MNSILINYSITGRRLIIQNEILFVITSRIYFQSEKKKGSKLPTLQYMVSQIEEEKILKIEGY